MSTGSADDGARRPPPGDAAAGDPIRHGTDGDAAGDPARHGPEGGAEAVVILGTAPSEDEARALASDLVGSGLAACVNIVPGIRSIYRWQGRVEDAAEVLLIAKSTRSRSEAVVERLARLHSYDVPEVLVLPVLGGHAPYLEWIAASVSG